MSYPQHSRFFTPFWDSRQADSDGVRIGYSNQQKASARTSRPEGPLTSSVQVEQPPSPLSQTRA